MMARLKSHPVAIADAPLPAENSYTAHAGHIATNFLNELWRTRATAPSVNIPNLLKQREYCIDAALRLSRVGRGSVDALPNKSLQVQHQLTAAAVDAVAQSWKLKPQKLKHVAKAVQAHLKAKQIDVDLCPPINPPVPMKVFDHPHLCPPVSIAAPIAAPGLVPITPIAMRSASPDMSETQAANNAAYEQARSSKTRRADKTEMTNYEKALWKNMQEKPEELEVAFATKGWGQPQALVPMTPVVESNIAARPPKPVKTTPVKVDEPAAPSCAISLQWLKELSAKKVIALSKESTFLAFADSHLAGFDRWKVDKSESVIEGMKANMINARLCSKHMTGRKFDFVANNGAVHRIETGMIIGATVQSQIFPSTQQINGCEVLVLASEHPISK